MVKSRVPEWLNSSLWSSPIDEDRFSRYASKFATTDSPVSPPVPILQPEPPRQPEPPTRPPVGRDTDNEDENGGCTAEDIARQAQLVVELSRKVINVRVLRRLSLEGIPGGAAAGIRPTVWKILLGYLPCEQGIWSTELFKKRSQYHRFKEDLLMNPSEITRRLEKSAKIANNEEKFESTGPLPRSRVAHEEHPLSLGKNSIWYQYFQDSEIIEQIERDVKRTHPNMDFFCGDSALAKHNQEAMRRILIIFAKLNPDIRYVQGMNEVLAPIFYVFNNDPELENSCCRNLQKQTHFFALLSF